VNGWVVVSGVLYLCGMLNTGAFVAEELEGIPFWKGTLALLLWPLLGVYGLVRVLLRGEAVMLALDRNDFTARERFLLELAMHTAAFCWLASVGLLAYCAYALLEG
jgi:hypothetical protein